MRRDSRLSVALHVLLHMREMGRVVTSEALGPMMKMNPVVVRRTIAGLRDAGIVRSEKGHGGGWSLARELDSVTLAEVYEALGTPPFFSIGHRDEKPRCLLEQAVNRELGQALDEAESLILRRLGSVSVAGLASSVRYKNSPRARKGAGAHV
jgi:DNA-binding IscR family transcriptional regulator